MESEDKKNLGSEIDDKKNITLKPVIYESVQSNVQTTEKNKNRFAIIGFILSFFTIFIGLIFSIIGFKKSKKTNVGKGLSKAGIFLSIFKILFLVFIIVLLCDEIISSANNSTSPNTDTNNSSVTTPNDEDSNNDILSSFKNPGTTFYFYESTFSSYLSVSTTVNGYDGYIQLGTYKCNSTCTAFSISDSKKNIVIFDDNHYFIYNINTKEKENINIDLAPYYSVEITEVNDEPVIIVIGIEDDEDTHKIRYLCYDLENEKTIVEFDEYDEILAPSSLVKDGYIAVGTQTENALYGCTIENNFKTLNISTGELGDKSFNGVLSSENTYYFYEGYGDDVCIEYIDVIYDSNYEKLLTKLEDTYFTHDENLIISDGNTYYIYDKNQKLIYTSKKYKSIYNILEDYIVVKNDLNEMIVIDYKENKKVKLTDIDNNYVHTLISGWYTINGKTGIYMEVSDSSITCDDFDDETLLGLFADDEDKKDVEAARNNCYKEKDEFFCERDFGYAYYYIPSTGETGKYVDYMGGYGKPVLYLYPENDNTLVRVTFEKPELLTTTYPKYIKQWLVIADKNGDLKDVSGRSYYGLYWEEAGSNRIDYSTGFYVTSKDSLKFLEEKLDIIGFTEREANEFIMYWLPILEKNKQSLVYFELTEERDSYNRINITPTPDSLLRVAIHVKKVNKKVNIKEEKLTTFNRNGFTAVEWGGVSE